MINATERSASLRLALHHRAALGRRRGCGIGRATAGEQANGARVVGPGLRTSGLAIGPQHGQQPSRPGSGIQLPAGSPWGGRRKLTFGAADGASWQAASLPRPSAVLGRPAAAPPPGPGTRSAVPAWAPRHTRSAVARAGISAVTGPAVEPPSDAVASGRYPATSRAMQPREGRPPALAGGREARHGTAARAGT